MEIWASGHMVGERWASLVNPELERGHCLYSDGQTWGVAETNWAGLKAQPLYSPALDVGFLRGRSWARDCGRKILKWTKQVLCLPAAYTIPFLQGNSNNDWKFRGREQLILMGKWGSVLLASATTHAYLSVPPCGPRSWADGGHYVNASVSDWIFLGALEKTCAKVEIACMLYVLKLDFLLETDNWINSCNT